MSTGRVHGSDAAFWADVRRLQEFLGPYAEEIADLMTLLGSRPRWDYLPGSDLAKDDAATGTFMISEMNIRALATAVDHLNALCITTLAPDGGLPVTAAYTLIRVGIEAGCVGLWLLGPDDPSTRVQRALWLAGKDIRDERTAFRCTMEHPETLPVPSKTIAEIMAEAEDGYAARLVQVDQLATAAGVTIPKRDPGSVLIVSEGSEFCKTGARILPAWRQCSAFAHARPWASKLQASGGRAPRTDGGLNRTADPVRIHEGLVAARNVFRYLIKYRDLRGGRPAKPINQYR